MFGRFNWRKNGLFILEFWYKINFQEVAYLKFKLKQVLFFFLLLFLLQEQEETNHSIIS